MEMKATGTQHEHTPTAAAEVVACEASSLPELLGHTCAEVHMSQYVHAWVKSFYICHVHAVASYNNFCVQATAFPPSSSGL